MRHFETPDGAIRGIESGQEELVKPDWAELSAEELQAKLNPPLATEDLAAAAMRRINAGYAKAMGAILAEYPDAETLSFDKQEREAREWIADNTAATPYLDAMLVERPIGKPELVKRIIKKADAFMQAHGGATGKRQRLEDEVKAALQSGDRATLETIGWDTTTTA